MLPISLTSFVVLAVGGLLFSDARGLVRRAFLCKASASLGFVSLALAVGALEHGVAAQVLLLGLVLAALGDVALAMRTPRSFLVGLSLFLFGHVAYVVAFAILAPLRTWPSVSAMLPVAATMVAYLWLAPRLGSMRVPVLAYMTTITVMVIGALAVSRAGAAHSPLLLGGAVLFYVSDLAVAQDRFVKSRFVNRAWGLPAYYAGQILLAWATG